MDWGLDETVQSRMTTKHNFTFFRWAILILLAILTIDAVVQMISFPAILARDSLSGAIYLALFLIAILINAWFVWFRVRANSPERSEMIRVGTFCGILCGLIRRLFKNLREAAYLICKPIL